MKYKKINKLLVISLHVYIYLDISITYYVVYFLKIIEPIYLIKLSNLYIQIFLNKIIKIFTLKNLIEIENIYIYIF